RPRRRPPATQMTTRRPVWPAAAPEPSRCRESDRSRSSQCLGLVAYAGKSYPPIERARRGIEQRIENPQRRGLGQRSGIPDRAHAAGTSLLALAVGNQLPRVRQQLVMHVEERRAESDAARVVVVDENIDTVGIRDL